jgi:hypothetical protein
MTTTATITPTTLTLSGPERAAVADLLDYRMFVFSDRDGSLTDVDGIDSLIAECQLMRRLAVAVRDDKLSVDSGVLAALEEQREQIIERIGDDERALLRVEAHEDGWNNMGMSFEESAAATRAGILKHEEARDAVAALIERAEVDHE